MRNGGQCLGGCLAALGRQTLADLEIVVVDDGSRDNTVAIARRFGVRVIRQVAQGPAAARNLGVRSTKRPLVLFTDADCRPAPNWAAVMSTVFDDPRVDGCCGTYTTKQNSHVARFVQLEFDDRYRRTATLATINFMDTYSAGYRRSAIETLGGFDERFSTASVEDQELSFRAASRGRRMVFLPNAIVEHKHPDDTLAYFKKKFKIGYYKPVVHRRHLRRTLSDSHTPPSVRVQTGLGILLAVAGSACPFSPLARRLVGLTLVVLAVSGLRLTLRNSTRDPVVGLISLPLIIVRSLALGTGLISGSFALSLRVFLQLRLGTDLLRLVYEEPSQRVQEGTPPESDREH